MQNIIDWPLADYNNIYKGTEVITMVFIFYLGRT